MIRTPAARITVAVVIVVSIAGAVFRIATAPERVHERREVARVACVNAGGAWVKVGADEMCRTRTDPAKGL